MKKLLLFFAVVMCMTFISCSEVPEEPIEVYITNLPQEDPKPEIPVLYPLVNIDYVGNIRIKISFPSEPVYYNFYISHSNNDNMIKKVTAYEYGTSPSGESGGFADAAGTFWAIPKNEYEKWNPKRVGISATSYDTNKTSDIFWIKITY